MKSSSTYHFPEIRFRNGRRKLFNPILKKLYKDLPEERVRLKMVEYLIHQTEWNRNRIGFEAKVDLPQTKNPLRADLILYTQEMTPYAIVECKSGSVSLTASAAEQIARYNTAVGAPYIMLTNGNADYWFTTGKDDVERVESPLPEIDREMNFRNGTDYWSARGFISPDSSDNVQGWTADLLRELWNPDLDWLIRYLNPSPPMIDYSITGNYRVIEFDEDRKLALAVLDDGRSSTRINAMLNKAGRNSGLLSVDLGLLFDGDPKPGVLYRQAVTEKVELSINPDASAGKVLKHLPKKLIDLFD